jgi:hypothetical protein
LFIVGIAETFRIGQRTLNKGSITMKRLQICLAVVGLIALSVQQVAAARRGQPDTEGLDLEDLCKDRPTDEYFREDKEKDSQRNRV